MAMIERGRIPKRERERARSRIIQALQKNPEGLGIRELKNESGIGSFETFYKYFRDMVRNKEVVYREVNVGRGKPKKIFKLSKKGIAYLIEFKIMEYFETIRESCKRNERFVLDNYDFFYAIYGMPENLDKEEREEANRILNKINLALLDLDIFRERVINKEAYKYGNLVSRIINEIFQSGSVQNKDKLPISIDSELLEEVWSFIPSAVREKMRLKEEEKFAVVATRGPSLIDEFSLRPENDLQWLVQSVDEWDDGGLDFVIEQLAKNNYVDRDAIDRIKKWNAPDEKIPNYYWQKIVDRLDDIPKIREEMRREKKNFLQSGDFKPFFGIHDDRIIVITKFMLGKEKLDEIKKELSNLK